MSHETAVWRASDRTERVNYSDRDAPGSKPTRSLRMAHLIRGGHTLCGRSASGTTWFDVNGDTVLCPTCSTVGPDGYTFRDVMEAGQITYRRCDHWSRLGWLHPINPDPGSGASRVYTAAEVEIARVMGRLVKAGIAPAAAERAARTGELAPGVRIEIVGDAA